MKEKNNLEIRVCKSCDAPLPFKPVKHSFFKKNKYICDDCIMMTRVPKKQ